jgi:hypothetical protein
LGRRSKSNFLAEIVRHSDWPAVIRTMSTPKLIKASCLYPQASKNDPVEIVGEQRVPLRSK